MSEPTVSPWKLYPKEKPEIGQMVMVGHLDPKGLPYNVTVACLDTGGHWRFTPNAPRTIGWVPTAFKSRFA